MIGIQAISFKDKKVLIRVDFNVPITEQGIITDDRRIRASLPTIQKIIKDGGIAILLAHFGRPKNGYEQRYSLYSILPALATLLQQPVVFLSSCVGQAVKERIATLAPGSVLLLENIRFHKEETVGDRHFAQALAALADVYINDAFGAIHRNHTSISLLPTYFTERYAGYLLEQEIAAIDKLFATNQSPFVAVMGGRKLVDKATPMQGLMRYVDHMLIGGGLISPFFYAKEGQSFFDSYDSAVAIATELFDKLVDYKNCKLWLPTDVVTVPQSDNKSVLSVLPLSHMPHGAYVVDIGPVTQAHFTTLLAKAKAKTILWAGPVGVFEWNKCAAGTLAVAQAIAQATSREAYSMVGGGDTAAAMKKIGYENHFSHICTGEGALLAYIAAGRKLPSLEVLKR